MSKPQLPTASNLDHLLDLARRGAIKGSSENEKRARRVVQTLLDNLIGLDRDATSGIGEMAMLIYSRGFDACDAIESTIEPAFAPHKNVNHLELRREPSGLRHYLDEKPVRAGTLIEIFTEARGWTLGRYEWSFQADRSPIACIDEDSAITIDDETPARWPAADCE